MARPDDSTYREQLTKQTRVKIKAKTRDSISSLIFTPIFALISLRIHLAGLSVEPRGRISQIDIIVLGECAQDGLPDGLIRSAPLAWFHDETHGQSHAMINNRGIDDRCQVLEVDQVFHGGPANL